LALVSGDGCFDVKISPTTTKLGHRVQLRFRITQHNRDIKLMEYLIKYLGAGTIHKYSEKLAVTLTIVKLSDITNIIIPFFDKNPLLGVKLLDYRDWDKIAKLMSDGALRSTDT
jgi:hypothetical protein